MILDNFRKKNKLSLSLIAFLQSYILIVYIGLVAYFMSKATTWFGTLDQYYGPILFLCLFVTSALISGLLIFGYPIYLFWDKKQTKEALRIVIYSTFWLVLFFTFLLIALIIF